MADFSTILHPSNDTLNLYCHSITADVENIHTLNVVDLNVSGTATINNEVVGNLTVTSNLAVNGTIQDGSLTANRFVATYPISNQLQSFNPPYFYGIASNTIVYDVSSDIPVEIQAEISSNISVSSDVTLHFAIPGVYNFVFNSNGTNLSDGTDPLTLPGPYIGVVAVLFDGSDSEVHRSILCPQLFPPADPSNDEFPTTITTNCLFNVQSGYVVRFLYSASSTPLTYSVSFGTINVSINFVSFP